MSPEETRAIHTSIWRRVQRAADRGVGLRLTATEVEVLSRTDFSEDPCIANNDDGTPATR